MIANELKTNLITVLTGITLVMISVALIFSHLENWSFINSLYFVVMTATTVGYGDVTPTMPLTKIITIVYALSIIPFMLYIFSLVAEFETRHVYKKMQHIERTQEKHEEALEETMKKIEQHELVQEKEIQAQEKELEVVEEIVGSALASK